MNCVPLIPAIDGDDGICAPESSPRILTFSFLTYSGWDQPVFPPWWTLQQWKQCTPTTTATTTAAAAATTATSTATTTVDAKRSAWKSDAIRKAFPNGW